MRDALNDAGWGVFPVLICGLLAVLLSLAFAVSLRRELLPLLAVFWVLTLLDGGLGFGTGLYNSAGTALSRTPVDLTLLVESAREASVNVLAALYLTIAATCLIGVGAFRIAWRGSAQRGRAPSASGS
jgi:hypothetical protein